MRACERARARALVRNEYQSVRQDYKACVQLFLDATFVEIVEIDERRSR